MHVAAARALAGKPHSATSTAPVAPTVTNNNNNNNNDDENPAGATTTTSSGVPGMSSSGASDVRKRMKKLGRASSAGPLRRSSKSLPASTPSGGASSSKSKPRPRPKSGLMQSSSRRTASTIGTVGTVNDPENDVPTAATATATASSRPTVPMDRHLQERTQQMSIALAALMDRRQRALRELEDAEYLRTQSEGYEKVYDRETKLLHNELNKVSQMLGERQQRNGRTIDAVHGFRKKRTLVDIMWKNLEKEIDDVTRQTRAIRSRVERKVLIRADLVKQCDILAAEARNQLLAGQEISEARTAQTDSALLVPQDDAAGGASPTGHGAGVWLITGFRNETQKAAVMVRHIRQAHDSMLRADEDGAVEEALRRRIAAGEAGIPVASHPTQPQSPCRREMWHGLRTELQVRRRPGDSIGAGIRPRNVRLSMSGAGRRSTSKRSVSGGVSKSGTGAGADAGAGAGDAAPRSTASGPKGGGKSSAANSSAAASTPSKSSAAKEGHPGLSTASTTASSEIHDVASNHFLSLYRKPSHASTHDSVSVGAGMNQRKGTALWNLVAGVVSFMPELRSKPAKSRRQSVDPLSLKRSQQAVWLLTDEAKQARNVKARLDAMCVSTGVSLDELVADVLKFDEDSLKAVHATNTVAADVVHQERQNKALKLKLVARRHVKPAAALHDGSSSPLGPKVLVRDLEAKRQRMKAAAEFATTDTKRINGLLRSIGRVAHESMVFVEDAYQRRKHAAPLFSPGNALGSRSPAGRPRPQLGQTVISEMDQVLGSLTVQKLLEDPGSDSESLKDVLRVLDQVYCVIRRHTARGDDVILDAVPMPRLGGFGTGGPSDGTLYPAATSGLVVAPSALPSEMLHPSKLSHNIDALASTVVGGLQRNTEWDEEWPLSAEELRARLV